ncbi:MAG: LPS assembly protein LptD, partial [Caulobacterales bacterium]|nr:LPS assembly protein LptD [Caulobacterales bacterium]
MTAVRPNRPVRVALMMGAAAGSLVISITPAVAQTGNNRGYSVGSSASAVASQTFDGAPSNLSPNPVDGSAPRPLAPSLGGPPLIVAPAEPVRLLTQQELEDRDNARRAAELAATNDDGLGEDGFYLEADLVTRDNKARTITATGGVESRYGGRTLRANQVTYDQSTGIVTARGNAVLVDTEGGIEFADELVLDDATSTGFARNFSARLAENVTMAASTAVRRSKSVSELNDALYTPCELCADDPSKAPSWSFRAEKVVQDHQKQVIYYRKAKFYLWGVPTVYLPVFWTTDPKATRASGFLKPKITISKRRGFSYEQPYLKLLGPSSDIIVSPQLNTAVNPFLNVNYRKRFYSGTAEVRGGFTHDQDYDSKGDKFGDNTFRSYILAKGRFDLNEKWLWGFSAERASEDLVLDKYDIGDIYLQEARGLFPDQERRFSSQLYAIRQDERTYLSISAVSIQGLIPSRDGNSGDNDRTFPLIAPLIEGRWDPDFTILGGRLRVKGQSVMLTREQSNTISPSAADPRPAGIDSRRAAGELDWRANYTSRAGIRLSPFMQGRLTGYDIGDLPGDESKRTVQAQGVIGADLS